MTDFSSIDGTLPTNTKRLMAQHLIYGTDPKLAKRRRKRLFTSDRNW